MRLVICGGPKTGKTTLGGPDALHTDDLIATHGWSQDSQHIADDWLERPGPWTIEGVTAVRGLRKWLRANPEGKPCDKALLLTVPHVELTPKQASMAKGIATVWDEIATDLRSRGVIVDAMTWKT